MTKVNLRPKRPSSYTRLLSRVGVWDVAWSAASPLAAYLLRDWTLPVTASRAEGIAEYCAISFLCSLFIFQWFQTSAPISRFFSMRDAFALVKACALIAAFSAALAFVFTRLNEAPRSLPLLHFLLLTAGLLSARMVVRLHELRGGGRTLEPTSSVQHVVLIGATRLALFFSKMVEELVPGQYQVVAILDERPEMRGRSLNGYPIIGSPAHLDKVLDDYAMHGIKIDKVIVATQPSSLSKTAWGKVSGLAKSLNIDLEVLSELLISGAFASVAPQTDGEHDAATASTAFDDVDEIRKRAFWKVKRVVDFIFALVTAVALLPVALTVSALVLFDVGIPVIFWQQRVGRNGAPLHVYKFRTLQTPFEPRTLRRRHVQAPSLIGRLLRATRLDEIPQLWNIMSGDMSLVGPRPLLPADQPRDASRRLAVRPGLTGWAQVCGANLISPAEKNALDGWYVRNASAKLDAIIFVRTIWMFMAGERRDERAISVALHESTFDDLRVARREMAPRQMRDKGAALRHVHEILS